MGDAGRGRQGDGLDDLYRTSEGGTDGWADGTDAEATVPRRLIPEEELDTQLHPIIAPDDEPADASAAVDTGTPKPARALVEDGEHSAPSRWQLPFTKALGLTALGAVFPGLGLVNTRFRKIGLGILFLAVFVVLVVGLWVVSDPFEAAKIGTRPRLLRAITAVLAVGAMLWALLIAGTHMIVRPRELTDRQRALGAVVVALLAFLVTTPMAVAARYAWDQAAFVDRVFGANDKKRSLTRPDLNTRAKSEALWREHPRLNLLLVGLDDNKGRDYVAKGEVSTDTIMVASISTQTGDMVLVQVPRNMARTPFPKGSELEEVYPEGFTNGWGDAPEFQAKAIWNNVPAEHPALFEGSDYKGADALKKGMEGALGLQIDYFMALNIDGLTGLINAMGGIRLNINEPIPIGGTSEGRKPHTILQPGPDQKLSGYNAMWYARSRSASSDYDRMGRQSCVIKAVIDQADPQTMLTRYEAITKASSDAVTTDIPSDMLPHMVDLAERVKGGRLDRILFNHGKHGYNTGNPDFDMMRSRVAEAIRKQGGTPPPMESYKTPTPTPTPTEATLSPTPSRKTSGTPGTPTPKPIENLTDVCAYNPVTPSETPR